MQPLLFASEYESLENILSNRFDNQFTVGISHSRFDQSLDILNYADKLETTKPKEALINSYYLGYRFDQWKLSFESNDSSGEVERLSIPRFIETDVKSETFIISYNFHENNNSLIQIGLLHRNEDQDPVTIDCYAFGETVIGGSCDEAELNVLNSEAYRTSGELIYEPVLRTSGKSDSQGIYLRLSSKSLGLLNLNHTFSFKNSKINQDFTSSILNTSDSFIRGLTVDDRNAGRLLDQFKDELPQTTPWKENTFKYSISNLIPVGENFAISGMYSFIKVKRKNYLNNPSKKDFTENHLIDLSLFYSLTDNSLLYLKLSASSNYLIGENPLAYNRRSNHLFDHPYGQVNAGLILNF
jgi:hypothetical protein